MPEPRRRDEYHRQRAVRQILTRAARICRIAASRSPRRSIVETAAPYRPRASRRGARAVAIPTTSSRNTKSGNVGEPRRQRNVVDLTIRVSTCQRVLRAVNPLEDEVAMRLAATWKLAEPQLLRIAERLCGCAADARDLVQDTFERAARQGLPADVRSPCAWLTTIMHHLFVDRCRANARKPAQEPLCDAHESMVHNNEPDDEPPWGELTVEDIRAALPEIDRIYRDVYQMHSFDGRSYEAIASRLKIDRVTVGTRLSRARKMLRAVLSRRRETKP